MFGLIELMTMDASFLVLPCVKGALDGDFGCGVDCGVGGGVGRRGVGVSM